MDQEFLTRSEPPPRVSDAMIAMRVPSLVVFLASACVFGMPILYYGMSHELSGANSMCVGGILLLSATLRLWYPLSTVGFSWFNMLLGLWIIISPWIFGYSYVTAPTVHSVCMGIVIVGMSIASVYGRRFPGTPLATTYADLEHQDYDYLASDLRQQS
jgi:hypothetical protein